jgi:lysine/ornithine N-monooxygenase
MAYLTKNNRLTGHARTKMQIYMCRDFVMYVSWAANRLPLAQEAQASWADYKGT